MKPERRIFEFDNIRSICEAHSKFFDSCRETHLKCRAEYCPIWQLGNTLKEYASIDGTGTIVEFTGEGY